MAAGPLKPKAEKKALRGDWAAQRCAQIAVERAKDDWLTGPWAKLAPDFARYADGADLIECSTLNSMIESGTEAKALVQALTGSLASAMSQHHTAQIPFRHQYQGGIGMLQLVTSGRAALSVLVYEDDRRNTARSVAFADSDCHEIVIAGTGEARLLTKAVTSGERAKLTCENARLFPGTYLEMCGPHRAKLMDEADGAMVVLRLSRTPENPQPSREYRLSDGALIHTASSSRDDSRKEAIASVLGAMGRRDSVPELINAARSGGPQLRWQCVRQTLALDTAAGFSLLCQIAEDSADELAPEAAQLRAQLLGQYPQLRNIECQLCPA